MGVDVGGRKRRILVHKGTFECSLTTLLLKATTPSKHKFITEILQQLMVMYVFLRGVRCRRGFKNIPPTTLEETKTTNMLLIASRCLPAVITIKKRATTSYIDVR